MKVGVAGASGQMGSLAASTILETEDLHLVGLYDVHTSGNIGGLAISKDMNVLDGCDVILEFSRPDVVMENLEHWRQFGADVVVGTSGFDTDRLEALSELWGNGPGNCLVVPNFSIGGVLMMKLAELVAPHFPASEIIEMHHDGKADAPSGTAMATAKRIASKRPKDEGDSDGTDSHPAFGAVVEGIRIHSVRLPGLVAHQRVLFGGEGEILTIGHDTIDRSSFMPGVLLAVRSVQSQKDVVSVGLEGLLGL
jgi:4-hydroxy-tetrahydrodipicolinate reductase